MIAKKITNFFKLETAGGILLGVAAIIAVILENSPLDYIYDTLLTTQVVFKIDEFSINKPLLLWINDGLMAIFFLFVGLEIKREVLVGKLSSKEQILLPAIAAFGGLALPALIYSYFNWGDAVAMHGWAIPAATDIAFALGVLLLLGNKVPSSLKICLLAIAIIDDLAAIIIIALFYTENLSFISLAFGLIGLVMLFMLNRMRVRRIAPYILTGIFLWACVLKSGVHATLAGVIVAFFIPFKTVGHIHISPGHALERGLKPWVAFLVLPLFAFANAGVPLKGMSSDVMFDTITFGILAGLFFGKQIGIMATTALCVLLKICTLPQDVNWKQYYGMSLLTGIGFTMSLFIGTLAFDGVEHQNAVRLGVLSGSLLSGLCGYAVLYFISQSKRKQHIK